MLTLTIEDTLAKNMTYNIVLNNCIKDNNEGNILDSLFTILSTSDKIMLDLASNHAQPFHPLVDHKNLNHQYLYFFHQA